jgi:hypothetical protein
VSRWHQGWQIQGAFTAGIRVKGAIDADSNNSADDSAADDDAAADEDMEEDTPAAQPHMPSSSKETGEPAGASRDTQRHPDVARQGQTDPDRGSQPDVARNIPRIEPETR